MLLALLEDRPKPLSRADIQARSGNRVGDGGAVEVHVHHLRKKLGEQLIETVGASATASPRQARLERRRRAAVAGGGLRRGVDRRRAALAARRAPQSAAAGAAAGYLAANLVGGYAIGLVPGWLGQHPEMPLQVRLFLVTGLLGGLTTFSTLRRGGRASAGRPHRLALLVAMAHLAGSLLLTAAGLATMRAWGHAL